MNLHLFLDVVAWIGAILFTLSWFVIIIGTIAERFMDIAIDWPITKKWANRIAILATICWAWIVVG